MHREMGSRSPLFRDLTREHGFESLRVEGKLPVDLEGTLYRNGPALFGSFGRRYDHLFESDGAISAVRFGGGLAQGAHRVTRSPGLLQEREEGRPLFGSVVSRPRRILNALTGRTKNVANTNVLAWQGRLFGMVESSKPMEVSPVDLETIGECDLDGVVAETFSAHPHFVAARRAFYNFGMRFGAKSAVDLYELPLRGPARRIGALALDAPTVLHDFIATDRHLVFFLAPTRLLLVRAMLGEARADRLFDWHPEHGSEIVVVPIDGPERVVRFRTDPFFTWHFANAFERDDSIVVDFVRHPDVSAIATMRDVATRGGAVVDMDGGQMCRATVHAPASRFETQVLSDTKCEFPTIDGRGAGSPRRFVWLATTDTAPRRIVRFDLERAQATAWTPPRGHHVSEPVFVPRPGAVGETEGWVLVLVYDEDAETSHVAVLDAEAPDAGPLGQAHFEHHVPVTLHGAWVARTKSA